jgi:hypothetical protein
MKEGTKYATTSISVDKTVAKMQQLLARKDVREISLQFAERGTLCTIMFNTKTYDFWLPGAYSFSAFSRAIQEVLTHVEAKAEHHGTP